MNTKVTTIIKNAEAKLLAETGMIYRLSVDFSLPDYALEALDKLCACWGIERYQLHDKSRAREVVNIRFIAMLFLRNECRLSLKVIGRYFDMDHTSVIWAIKQCHIHLHTGDPVFRTYYEPVKHLFE